MFAVWLAHSGVMRRAVIKDEEVSPGNSLSNAVRSVDFGVLCEGHIVKPEVARVKNA